MDEPPAMPHPRSSTGQTSGRRARTAGTSRRSTARCPERWSAGPRSRRRRVALEIVEGARSRPRPSPPRSEGPRLRRRQARGRGVPRARWRGSPRPSPSRRWPDEAPVDGRRGPGRQLLEDDRAGEDPSGSPWSTGRASGTPASPNEGVGRGSFGSGAAALTLSPFGVEGRGNIPARMAPAAESPARPSPQAGVQRRRVEHVDLAGTGFRL